MDHELFRARYNDLVIEINKHNELYYKNNTPVISDQEYDKLYNELKELEEQFPELISTESPLKKVGYETENELFTKVIHKNPMLSLGNTYNLSEVFNFLDRIAKSFELNTEIEVVCEPKFDGISIELVYENGRFVRAVTRGDGVTGDDVTKNVKLIKSIPEKSNLFRGNFAIRGEIFMTFSTFESLNAVRIENGEKLFMNPRNAAGGTLHLKDTSEAAKRPLEIYVYDLLTEHEDVKSHDQMIKLLSENNFPVFEKSKVLNVKDRSEIENIIKSWDLRRANLEFPVDGLVFKVNSFKQRQILGTNIKDPRWGFAFKFPSDELETELLDVELNVGRTGAVTPVAVLKPVLLDGTRVSRASLHNFDYIKEKDLRIHDIVKVKKAGEIIPQVTVLVRHTDFSFEIKVPENCPSCGYPLSRKITSQKKNRKSENEQKEFEEEKALRCTNFNCSSRMENALIHFISRDMMNFDTMGEKLVHQLFEKGLVRKPSDFYKLTVENLSELERMGKKSAKNIIDSIEKSKTNELWRIIHALGISGVGKANSKLLANHLGSFEKLLSINDDNREDFRDELISIDGIGDTVAADIISLLSDELFIEELKILAAFLKPQINTQVSGVLSGKSLCITGTLSKPRDYFEKLISENGGMVRNSVSSKLDFLVCGDNAGSKKEKAEKAGVKILSENELISMLASV